MNGVDRIDECYVYKQKYKKWAKHELKCPPCLLLNRYNEGL